MATQRQQARYLRAVERNLGRQEARRNTVSGRPGVQIIGKPGLTFAAARHMVGIRKGDTAFDDRLQALMYAKATGAAA